MEEREVTEFEKRARLAKPYFNQRIRYSKDIMPAPFIEEFLGTPSSGKTTLIKEVDKFWKRQGFRSYHPQEGAEAVRYLDRTTPFYNIATGLYAFQILIQISAGHQYDHVLFDRCVFDAYTWMKYWFKKGKLSKEMMHMLQESFLTGADRVDIAFTVICDPEIAIGRETKNELTKQVGDHTNTDTIKLLIECNLESYEELKPRFPQLILLDTTEIDEKTMVQNAAATILQTLEKKIIAASV